MIYVIVSEILLLPVSWLPSTCISIICKTSKVSSRPTSANLAAILDFQHTSTSRDIGSTTTRKLDPENIGSAVGIWSLCALDFEHGGHPPLPANIAKKPLLGEGLRCCSLVEIVNFC